MDSVYDLNNKKPNYKCKMFLDEENNGVTIARYDHVKYPRIEKMTDKQTSFFWRPEEVDISRDKKDFEDLSEHERHIFTSNLKRQILLDSVQGRAPAIAFGAITSLPEVEVFIDAWQYFESIHSRSYTHLIRNVYSNPSRVFDEINDIPEIIDCATDVSKYYDDLIDANRNAEIFGYSSIETKYYSSPDPEEIGTRTFQERVGVGQTKYEHKKKLWLALMAVNILEGIRFYVSFACSWAFAENKKMEGNAKIIKFICRDENLHLGFTQFVLNALPKDDKDFVKIREETYDECVKMFVDAAEQEKEWAEYLFKDGSIIGLTEDLLSQYVEWIANKRMNAVGLKCPYIVPQANPLPWTEGWISGKERQVAPQQAQISSYLTGEIDKSGGDDFLDDLSI